ncbi:biotin transporter BioY [Curtanaerobium respiraculi]|uniref:biotin transporter BioY n=1 Tax=Curtanaerobium respiraculi TaxID=2949669 RepID=UPI0024B354A7|nr:biotin transporter BioY [Curtanaerobium respiraculi]
MEKRSQFRTRSIAFVGLSVALLAVSAWITIPLGPVPFTMQTFVCTFLLLALSPSEALASLALYVVLGAIGLPLFSGMSGGIGRIMGPTGGFLWGFVLGGIALVGVLALAKRRSAAIEYLAAGAFLIVVYLAGWLQLAAVSGMGLEAAFLAGVAPFIVLDAIKIALAVPVARAVRHAVGNRRSPSPAKL